MPIYITDTNFFSDKYGIGKTISASAKRNSADSFSRHTAPDHLTLTHYILPENAGKKSPAFFMLSDDTEDFEGIRFSDLYDTLKSRGFAVFHFHIGKDPQDKWSAVFEEQLAQLFLQYPDIDTTQLYIGGFGHGVSHMLAITGQSKHFRAAVSVNAFVNYTTAYGNYEGCHEDFLQSGQPDFASWLYAMAEQCPFKYLDDNQTPYLILHSHRDYICPEEQSEELFSAIKDRIPKVPCRMIIFPEENHEILLPGHQKYQTQITDEILQWFQMFQEDPLC